MKTTGWPAKLIAFVASIFFVPAFVFAAHNDETPSTKPSDRSANVASNATAPIPSIVASAKDGAKWKEAYGNLPLAFEQNLGQTDSQVQFLARGDGYQIFLASRETILALRQPVTSKVSPLNRTGYAKSLGAQARTEKASIVRIQLMGANPAPRTSGLDRLPGKTDYFIGNDPKNWRTDVPSFARVQYRDVYPGVDLVFYGKQRHFEYDFVVNPGSDPKAIALNVTGAQKLRLDGQGNLVLDVDGGTAELQKPAIYQTVNDERREIAGEYVLDLQGHVTFAVAAYDKTQPLIIDPVLNYSTYLGGSAMGDEAYAIAVDASGDAYVAGQTFSGTFPHTSGAFSATLAPSGSVFVTELNPTGTALVYSTYLSGDVGEAGFGIAVDPAATASCPNALSAPGVCIYVTGETFSTVFPTTGNGYSQSPIANPTGTAFVAKLNPALSGPSSLVYSSYLGGTNGDFGNAIAVDATGNAYVAGYTNSAPGAAPTDFTVVGGDQATLNSASGNAFLARIDTTKSAGASLIYSTYLGGSGTGSCTNCLGLGDVALGVAVDASQNAYVTGATTSTDFPTTSNAYRQAPFANAANQAVFVSRIDTTKTLSASLIYSTYLASAAPTADLGNAIALGPGNKAYVAGQTSSTAFPVTVAGTTAGQFPSPPSTLGVSFVSVIDTTQTGPSSLTYSELLGGTAGDAAQGIRVGATGNAYIAGVTASTNFPIISGAFQPTLSNITSGDAFIAKIAPLGNGASDLLYSTYFGGSGNGTIPDRALGLAIDPLNNAYIAGQTASTNFPVFSTGGTAFQTTLTGTSAAFVAKLTLEPTVAISPSSLSFTSQVVGVPSTAQTVTFTNNNGTSITMTSVTVVAGSPVASGTDFATTANTCTGTITAGAQCTVGVIFTASTPGTETATLTFTDSDVNSPQRVSLSGTSAAAVLTIGLMPSTPLAFGNQTVGTTSSAQAVTVTDIGNAPITFGATAISVTGNFTQTNTCNSTTLQPSPGTPASCTITVKFAPTSTGALTGVVSIADNATGSPQTVNLTGTGIAVVPTVSVTPSTGLTFTSQTLNTTSTPQTVTVTNTGTVPVVLGASAISITGDYAVASTTCNGATLQAPPSAPVSCTINVTFTPTATTNPRTGTLSIADNASGSPQMVSLTGTATAATTPDFSLSFPSQSITIARGATGNFTVNVVSLGGFTTPVAFTCTGTIPQGSCAPPSGAVTPTVAPGTAATFSVVTKSLLAIPPSSLRTPPLSMRQIALLGLAALMLLMLPAARRLRTRFGLIGAMAAFLALAGCSSSPSTPTGTYTLTVTGTAGSATHSATVTVNVD